MLLARIMLPSLTLIALAAAFMGMLNSLHHFFIPALSPAMFNVADDHLRVRARAVDAGVRPRRRSWRSRSARCSAASRSSRCSGRRCTAKDSGIASSSTGSDPGLRRVLMLMGPGTVGLAATQVNVFVNTVLATGDGDRRGVVAELRVPADVSADRAVRRVDRDRRRCRRCRAMQPTATTDGGARHDRQRPVADADAERAGDASA